MTYFVRVETDKNTYEHGAVATTRIFKKVLYVKMQNGDQAIYPVHSIIRYTVSLEVGDEPD